MRRISVARSRRSDIELPELADLLEHAVDVQPVQAAQLALRARGQEGAWQPDAKHLDLQLPVGDKRRDGAADAAVEDTLLDRDDTWGAREDFGERFLGQRLQVAQVDESGVDASPPQPIRRVARHLELVADR